MPSLRKWLFSGLLVLVPLIITLWVLEWVVSTLDQTLRILPTSWQPDQLLGMHIPGLGVVFALVVVLSIGALASNIIGNRLVNWWHALLHRIPVVRSIYSGVKQVSDTLFSEKGNAFRKALLIEWPHEGMWTIGFLTGSPAGDVLLQLQAQPGRSHGGCHHGRLNLRRAHWRQRHRPLHRRTRAEKAQAQRKAPEVAILIENNSR